MAVGKVVFASVITGIGVGVGSIVGGTTIGDIEMRIERVESAEKATLQSDNDLQNLRLKLGEGCLRLMSQYSVDSQLAETPEDSIVSDLLSSDGRPCGEEATEIRSNVRKFTEIDSEMNESEADLEIAKQELKDQRELANNPWKRVFGGIGAGIGLAGVAIKCFGDMEMHGRIL